MYRKFWLENGIGNLFYLTEKQYNWFLADPDGLGLTINYSSIKLSDSEVITSKDYELMTVGGDLLFYAETNEQKYEDYFNFLRFVARTPIYLHYQTPNNTESYRTLVQLTNLEKTEVDEDGILHCPISFKRLSLWFGDTLNVIDVGNEIDNGKDYPLTRPYSYGAISYENMSILNNGMVEAPLLIEITGSVTDPVYSLSQDGVVYGRGKIIGTYDYVSIDSDDANENIILKVGDSTIANAVNYQDLTVGSPNEIYVTFLKARAGISTLRLNLPDGFEGRVRVTWRNAYLSV